MRRKRRRPNPNPASQARKKGSPYEQPEYGPFVVREDITIKAIETTQKGMIDAFEAGKKPEKTQINKNNPATIISYAIIISSYIIAVTIFFWKDRFSSDYQRIALGYIFSIVPASFLGITKSKE